MSCCLKTHSSGTSSHNGNPSILLGQDCVGGERTLSKSSLSFFGNHINIVLGFSDTSPELECPSLDRKSKFLLIRAFATLMSYVRTSILVK